MTNSPDIGRLEFRSARDAWAHEAHNFTPWLYDNLDILGDTVDMRLIGEATEVRVGSFVADIVARDALDDSRVLIENQLECSDHKHFGQILTYLAGLEAKTVFWVATEFSDPHLSAIKWLNENTLDEFSFFAIQVKTVRIGNSPFAALFEVLERPNTFERQLHAAAVRRDEYTPEAEQRHTFWSEYIKRVPGELKRAGEAHRGRVRQHVLDDIDMSVLLSLSGEHVGLYVRRRDGADPDELKDRLLPHQQSLEQKLAAPFEKHTNYFFEKYLQGDWKDPANWDRLIPWLAEQADLYERTLREVFGGSA